MVDGNVVSLVGGETGSSIRGRMDFARMEAENFKLDPQEMERVEKLREETSGVYSVVRYPLQTKWGVVTVVKMEAYNAFGDYTDYWVESEDKNALRDILEWQAKKQLVTKPQEIEKAREYIPLNPENGMWYVSFLWKGEFEKFVEEVSE